MFGYVMGRAKLRDIFFSFLSSKGSILTDLWSTAFYPWMDGHFCKMMTGRVDDFDYTPPTSTTHKYIPGF
jgi:hypothetical protein